MNQPNIKLLTFTADAEKLVCAAAKLCYASDPGTIFDNSGDEIRKFLARLRSMGHLSPFEHASYTFLLEGISRALTHQLVRHRIASYSQRSQRYVSHDSFDYIVPPSLRGKTVETEDGCVDAEIYFRDFMKHAAETYRRLLTALGGEHESAIEDARYVLPNATETKIMVTMNARELFHFFGERLCNRAQWEIRTAADGMLVQVRAVSPVIFRGIGPKCVQLGYCPEGKMSCGRMKEMRERYQ
ncbi:FAD-dependent thymidylate synthase [bacterium]|nr:FAD-dependent thymidylate synthase [bacterium]